jgi:hypothetical protein
MMNRPQRHHHHQGQKSDFWAASWEGRFTTIYHPFSVESAKAELDKVGLKDTDGDGIVNFPSTTPRRWRAKCAAGHASRPPSRSGAWSVLRLHSKVILGNRTEIGREGTVMVVRLFNVSLWRQADARRSKSFKQPAPRFPNDLGAHLGS